ncbi:MAG: hypothetical protein QXI52_05700 [Nitrososphaerota archaeon]
MQHPPSVIEKVKAVEQRLDELEEIASRYRREIHSLVEEVIRNTDQLFNQVLEEDKKRLMEEARKKAEIESERIIKEYNSRIEQLRKRLEENREKIVEDVAKRLLGL